jgi:hypothetical protein
MMKILKWLGGILVGLLVVLLVVGLCLPRKFRVERRIVIDAAPDRIHRLVNRFREWPAWTAWNENRYPGMQVSFVGPDEGVGAKYHWTGEASGTGDMEITASDPARGIEYDLSFENGEMLSTGAIEYVPEGESTRVTWHAAGDLGWNPVGRYFGLLLDGMMGPDLEKGLANLKARVEAEATQPADAAPTATPPAETQARDTPSDPPTDKLPTESPPANE